MPNATPNTLPVVRKTIKLALVPRSEDDNSHNRTDRSYALRDIALVQRLLCSPKNAAWQAEFEAARSFYCHEYGSPGSLERAKAKTDKAFLQSVLAAAHRELRRVNSEDFVAGALALCAAGWAGFDRRWYHTR